MRIGCVVVAIWLASSMAMACAQTEATTGLPEAPVGQTAAAALPPDPEARAGDSWYAPVAEGKEPQSQRLKAETYMVLAFGPRAMVSPAFSAARKMARPPKGYPSEWLDGGPAFGRNYGAALGSRVAMETGRYAAGALLHEDFRYRPSGKQGSARLFYALGYTFVDRSDSGHRRLAVANFAGAAAGGFAGNLYLPDGFNTPGDGARGFASRFGGFAMTNVTREFAPEIFHVARKLHAPFPRVPLPEWWTKGLSVSRP